MDESHPLRKCAKLLSACKASGLLQLIVKKNTVKQL